MPTTIGSSAQGEGPEFLDGSKVLVTRFQMPEAGDITEIENFLTTYTSGPHNYYAVIYRGTFSSPSTLAYSELVTGAVGNEVTIHELTAPISADEDEYLWGGMLCFDGAGASYSYSPGSADAPATGHTTPPSTLTPDYVEADYRWSCALTYTAGGGPSTTLNPMMLSSLF
jgi:hypothetical protein